MIKTNYLYDAVEKLFQPTTTNGYWDEENKRIGESLFYDRKFNWEYRTENKKRYGLFAISLLLLAEELNSLDLTPHKNKIVDYNKKIISELDTLSYSELTYGALLSVILAYKRNYISIDESKYEDILIKTLENVPKLYDNQLYLVLIAAKYFLTIKKSPKVQELINELLTLLLNSYTKNAFFNTGDPRGIYHQRRMYILWSMIFCSTLFYTDEIDRIVQHSLKYSLQKCRDGKDSAFLWHPPMYFSKYKSSFQFPIYNYNSSKYLFECHQTFFCNAALLHQKFIGTHDFNQDIKESINWIFGENRINKNLVEITKIHIPQRIMTTDGNLFVKGEKFKGSYELGSYILALSFLLSK
jgi:hypothetical protein